MIQNAAKIVKNTGICKVKQFEPAAQGVLSPLRTEIGGIVKPKCPAVKAETVLAQHGQIVTAAAKESETVSLSIEDKMRALGIPEKFWDNPDVISNVNRFYEFKMPHFYYSSHKLTFSPEALTSAQEIFAKDIEQKEIINRLCWMNYPLEIIKLTCEMGKSAPDIKKKVEVKDVAQGRELVEWYQSLFSRSGKINNALRKGKRLNCKPKEVLEFFDSHQRTLGEDTVLIRGTNHVRNVKPGDRIQDKGYMSCSTREGFLKLCYKGEEKFSQYKNFLVIRIPENQKMIVPYDYKGITVCGNIKDPMGERILPRGTSLKVVKVVDLHDYGKYAFDNPIEGRRAIVCEIV